MLFHSEDLNLAEYQYRFQRLFSRRFWADSTEALWVRVTDRLDAHIASLQNDFDTTSFVNGVRGLTTGTGVTSGGGSLPARAYALIRPHPIARRYAELGASLHSIGHAFPGSEYLCAIRFLMEEMN